MNKFEKLAWDIFQRDLIEDKLKAFFDKWKKLNIKIGEMVYEIITRRDEIATKEDVVFEFNRMKKIGVVE